MKRHFDGYAGFMLGTVMIFSLAGCGQSPERKEAVQPPPAAHSTGPVLNAGDVSIDMNKPDQARRLMLDGWCPVSDGAEGNRYVWATAQRTSVRLYAGQPELGGVFSFLTYPFQPKGSPAQTVQVYANGKVVEKLTLIPKETLYRVSVPASMLRKGDNRFEFEFDHVLSPSQLGLGTDERRLAALFKKIDFTPGTPDTSATPPKPGDLNIDMNQESQARGLLLDGWSGFMEGPPGGRYVWAIGRKSTFQFLVERVEKGGLLSFTAYPFRAAGLPPQTVTVAVNGQPAGEQTLAEGDRSYSIRIPADLLKPGLNRFEFSYAYSQAPAKTGKGTDQRQLAVMFRKIGFLPERDLREGDNYIDMNRATDAKVMLLEGWSENIEGPSGGRYLWAIGKRSKFRFFLEDPTRGGSLTFLGIPFSVKGMPRQTVDVYVNGRLLGKIVMGAQENIYSLKIPAYALLKGENRFEFAYAYSISPKNLGVGKDDRLLSVMIKRIYFVAD